MMLKRKLQEKLMHIKFDNECLRAIYINAFIKVHVCSYTVFDDRFCLKTWPLFHHEKNDCFTSHIVHFSIFWKWDNYIRNMFCFLFFRHCVLFTLTSLFASESKKYAQTGKLVPSRAKKTIVYHLHNNWMLSLSS